MSLALKLALSPLLVAQALRTRARVPQLPEASGARAGTHGRRTTRLRLLIAGDSSAAGVGVATQDDALAGHDHRMIRERGVAIHREHGHTLDRERVPGHPRWRVLRPKLGRRAASTGEHND